MVDKDKFKTKAIYITSHSGLNRGGGRYILSVFKSCSLDEKKILYNDVVPHVVSWIRYLGENIRILREVTDCNKINIIFIKSASVLDSLPPILFKIFSKKKLN